MQRYFVDYAYPGSEADFYLTGNDYHHAIHVMRMAVGNHCYLVCQDKIALVAEITAIEEETVILKELSRELQTKELPVEITIACAYPKGDKLDLVVQKGTELGSSHFYGFPGQTSVVKWDQKKLAKRQERLAKIAKEAAEQSHRHLQPTVTLFQTSQEFTGQWEQFDHVLIAYEESAKQGEQAQLVQTLRALTPGQRLLVVFGPEGGFSPAEIETYLSLGAKLCGLGPRILRAETAPFYVLSALSYHFELLN